MQRQFCAAPQRRTQMSLDTYKTVFWFVLLWISPENAMLRKENPFEVNFSPVPSQAVRTAKG